MKSIKIPKTNIYIHISIILLTIIFIIYDNYNILIIAFLFVFIHECAHYITAKLLKYNINSLEIFPFGGVLKINESIIVNPFHEILISIAGPLSNIVFAFIFNNIIKINNIGNYNLLLECIEINLMIGIFNLLPIIPLDGGRIVRAYLSMVLGYRKSVKIIMIISKTLCILLFCLGIYLYTSYKLNIIVSILAMYIYFIVCKEKEMSFYILLNQVIQKKKTKNSKTKFLIYKKNKLIKHVLNNYNPQKYHIITIIDRDGKYLGELNETDIINGLFKYGLCISLEKLLRKKENDKIHMKMLN